jgi:hypothetical protein
MLTTWPPVWPPGSGEAVDLIPADSYRAITCLTIDLRPTARLPRRPFCDFLAGGENCPFPHLDELDISSETLCPNLVQVLYRQLEGRRKGGKFALRMVPRICPRHCATSDLSDDGPTPAYEALAESWR